MTMCILLLWISICDIKTRRIPDGLILAYWIAGWIELAPLMGLSPWERITGSFFAALPLIAAAIARPGSFGGGDIKLMMAVGWQVGSWCGLKALCLGMMAGGLWSLGAMACRVRKRSDKIALGPFLCMGIFVIINRLFTKQL